MAVVRIIATVIVTLRRRPVATSPNTKLARIGSEHSSVGGELFSR
jgi:hypothetical protein